MALSSLRPAWPMAVLFGMVPALSGCAQPPGSPAPPSPVLDAELEERLLAAHNRERARAGARPLVWSSELASRAAAYAPTLVSLGRLEHAPRPVLGRDGENLWMGTAGAYHPERMVGAWADEKRHFRPGRFPDVSTTGDWTDVGHYTQIVWPSTRAVGCALERGNGWDVLICRYRPGGNVVGRRLD